MNRLSLYARIKGYEFPYRIRDYASPGCVRRLPFELHDSGGIDFFIIGAGRSGSTLLRSAIVSSMEVHIPPEATWIEAVARNCRAFRTWDDLVANLTVSLSAHPSFFHWDLAREDLEHAWRSIPAGTRSVRSIIDAVFELHRSQHSQLEKNSLIGDKTPYNTFAWPWIRRSYPTARYIHLIRDGRDVAASYLTSGLYQDAGRAAQRWTESVQAATAVVNSAGADRAMVLRYEDLVSFPEQSISRVAEFLRVPVLKVSEQARIESIGRLGDANQSHHTNLGRPIGRQSVGRHRLLPERAQRIIDVKTRRRRFEFGYAE